MNIATIEELKYLMEQAKSENLPKPIVFLGAGASKTGGVPLAKEIVEDILRKFQKNPKIRDVKEEDKTYPKLMGHLTPFDRNELLKEYINKAKINVTHIYLAQLIVSGYVDYVLTVNFDNLLLRALALYNEFPPTYDMAILKDITTASFKEKSVFYLHGQHHGLWLLNTDEEMAKVNGIIPPILHSIKNNRIWIFIGYGGTDPIFDHVKALAARFDNGLYWVTYNSNSPAENVCKELLDRDNSNTFLIKGYDSDSFMLKLNTALGLPQPEIIDKPFSALKKSLENIVDIDDQDHYKGAKERLEIAKSNVSKAISQFEHGDVELVADLKNEIDIDLLKKEIIDARIEEKLDDGNISYLMNRAAGTNDPSIKELMSFLLNDKGVSLYHSAQKDRSIQGYWKSIDFYKQSIDYHPTEYAFHNWGLALQNIAELTNNVTLLNESCQRYKSAIEIAPKFSDAYFNWGNALIDLAALTNNENLYKESIGKFREAVAINPDDDNSYHNWGFALISLGNLTGDVDLFRQSSEMFRKTLSINPNNKEAYNNFGNALSNLAKFNHDENTFKESFEKYANAVAADPYNAMAYYNWGTALLDFGRLTKQDAIFDESEAKFKAGISVGGKSYNLACLYAVTRNRPKALEALENCLSKKEVTVAFVQDDEDWKEFVVDEGFIALLEKYR